MSTFEFDPCVEFSISGNCPVQCEGKIADLPFYFRARHAGWSFRIAAKPDGDPVDDDPAVLAFSTEGPYGLEHEAGWMPTWDALNIIAACVRQYVTDVRLKNAKETKADGAPASGAKP